MSRVLAEPRRLLVLLALTLLVAGAAGAEASQPVRYAIDPEQSAVTFKATSRLVNADGRFHRFRGELTVDPSDLRTARVTVTVDAASLDTENTKRDNHLRSEDFFFVERFPTATFESVRAEPRDGGVVLAGRLTMRGVTKEVAVPLTVEVSEGGFTARGDFAINRTDFGINYQSRLNPVGDVVQVAFTFRGRRTER